MCLHIWLLGKHGFWLLQTTNFICFQNTQIKRWLTIDPLHVIMMNHRYFRRIRLVINIPFPFLWFCIRSRLMRLRKRHRPIWYRSLLELHVKLSATMMPRRRPIILCSSRSRRPPSCNRVWTPALLGKELSQFWLTFGGLDVTTFLCVSIPLVSLTSLRTEIIRSSRRRINLSTRLNLFLWFIYRYNFI